MLPYVYGREEILEKLKTMVRLCPCTLWYIYIPLSSPNSAKYACVLSLVARVFELYCSAKPQEHTSSILLY